MSNFHRHGIFVKGYLASAYPIDISKKNTSSNIEFLSWEVIVKILIIFYAGEIPLYDFNGRLDRCISPCPSSNIYRFTLTGKWAICGCQF